jgi:hypothetical protein
MNANYLKMILDLKEYTESIKPPKLMLHMHMIRDFIDNRNGFYNKYLLDKDPRFYSYKGVKKAFKVGSAVDYALKKYYIQKTTKRLLDSKEYNLLERIDKVLVNGLVHNYIYKYSRNEKLHSFRADTYQINFGKYVIYISPDLTARMFNTDELVIIELKTSGDAEGEYSAETLDFQTMTYVWGIFRATGELAKYVVKRTLMKPRIRQKKNETNSEFEKRLVEYIADRETNIKSTYREIDIDMVTNYEKYLESILQDLTNSWGKPYKFYKKSGDYWG